MYPCVEEAAWRYLGKRSHEGTVLHMYLDKEGWVTIGKGMKIDPLSEHLGALKKNYFVVKKRAINTAGKAHRELLRADYAAVTKMTHLIGKPNRVALPQFAAATNLRFTQGGLKNYYIAKARGYEGRLKSMGRSYFSNFDNWPADAQFGVLNMAWAFNVGGLLQKFPNFCKACRDMRFKDAARECRYDFNKKTQQFDSHSSKLRNATNRQLFLNAADVIARKKPLNVLIYKVT